MQITISGTAGSGKSTVAKLLAKRLGYRHYSMGDLQREIADKKGISISELGELEKEDPAIDRMVDDKQRELGETMDDFVIDSWLGAYFIPGSFKIFMDAKPEIRAKRIAGKRRDEYYKNANEAAKALKKREATNRTRWKRFYKYDFKDKKNYDLVLDTTDKSIEAIIGIILPSLGKK